MKFRTKGRTAIMENISVLLISWSKTKYTLLFASLQVQISHHSLTLAICRVATEIPTVFVTYIVN